MAAAVDAAASQDELFAAFFAYVDAHEEEYVDRLREAVAIESVSVWPTHRP